MKGAVPASVMVAPVPTKSKSPTKSRTLPVVALNSGPWTFNAVPLADRRVPCCPVRLLALNWINGAEPVPVMVAPPPARSKNPPAEEISELPVALNSGPWTFNAVPLPDRRTPEPDDDLVRLLPLT